MKKIPVPIVKQSEQACGPACLAMVLEYYKDSVPLAEIIKGVGGVKSFGVRAIRLAEYARGRGYRADCFSYDEKMAKGLARVIKPSKRLILKYLGKRIPAIIAVRTFLLWNTNYSKAGHYIVITKYDKGVFWYNDPHFAKEFRVKEDDLMFAWYNNILKSTGYMLAIKPKKYRFTNFI